MHPCHVCLGGAGVATLLHGSPWNKRCVRLRGLTWRLDLAFVTATRQLRCPEGRREHLEI